METFWFFWLRFRRAYASAYDSDSDSVASENQPLEITKKVVPLSYNCLMNDIVMGK